MLGRKAEIIADQAAEIQEKDAQLSDWASRHAAIQDYIPLAIALKGELENVLGAPEIRDDAYEAAQANVKERVMREELEKLTQQLEPEIEDEVRLQIRAQIEGDREAMKAKIAAELHTEGAFTQVAAEEEERFREMISEEVRAEERAKVDEEILNRTDEIKEEERARYLESEKYTKMREKKLAEAREKVKELTIDEVLEGLDGEVYEAARLERADAILQMEKDENRLADIVKKAQEKRKLDITDLQQEDILWISLGTYKYDDKPIFDQDRYGNNRNQTGTETVRTTEVNRKLKLAVVSPEDGTCLVLQDSLDTADSPYTRNDAFEDGEEIKVGTCRKGSKERPFVAELREDVQAAYLKADSTTPIVDAWGVCQLTILVGKKSADLFTQRPGK